MINVIPNDTSDDTKETQYLCGFKRSGIKSIIFIIQNLKIKRLVNIGRIKAI